MILSTVLFCGTDGDTITIIWFDGILILPSGKEQRNTDRGVGWFRLKLIENKTSLKMVSILSDAASPQSEFIKVIPDEREDKNKFKLWIVIPATELHISSSRHEED